MAKARLDTLRPYAQVYGPGEETEGAVHSQDGFFYTQDDVIMPVHRWYKKEKAAEAAELHASLEEEPKRKPQAAARAKEITEKVSQRKPEPPPPPPPPEVKAKPAGNKAADVDLRAWALSKKGYPFMAVRAAISSQYHFQAHNADSARAFLVDQGVIKESDLD